MKYIDHPEIWRSINRKRGDRTFFQKRSMELVLSELDYFSIFNFFTFVKESFVLKSFSRAHSPSFYYYCNKSKKQHFWKQVGV